MNIPRTIRQGIVILCLLAIGVGLQSCASTPPSSQSSQVQSSQSSQVQSTPAITSGPSEQLGQRVLTGGSSSAQSTIAPEASSAANQSAAPATGGPSPQEIAQVLTKWLDDSNRRMDRDSSTRITSWDSPLQMAPPAPHHYYAVGDTTVYPVKIDFTATTEHPTRIAVAHYRGGLYDFYKDPAGQWTFSLDELNQITNEPDQPK